MGSVIDLFLSFSIDYAKMGRVLRAIRLVRLVRTLRLARSLKTIHEFHKMVYAVLTSFRTLVCSMLVLGFVMFFFAVIFSQAASTWAMEGGGAIAGLEERYGSLSRAYYSLFISAMDGISWDLCFAPLLAIHPGFAVAFLVYIDIVLIGVMNVVTSVFVEFAIMSAQHYRDLIVQDKQLKKKIAVSHMQEVFKHMDDDGSGEISMDEMTRFLADPSPAST